MISDGRVIARSGPPLCFENPIPLSLDFERSETSETRTLAGLSCLHMRSGLSAICGYNDGGESGFSNTVGAKSSRDLDL